MSAAATLPLVSVLGDSRAFETYYANADYPPEALYGCDRTFPHLLRAAALRRSTPAWDVALVPDHFRGGSVESNCIRLGLGDPATCVLLDGIWETLLNKRHFLEWAEAELRRHELRSDEALDLGFSSRRLADLFVAGALSVSPARYAARQQQLISYFRRRRRTVIWMSLPIPPPDHLGGLHYAGRYQCLPEWGECLAAVNAAVRPVAEAFGADVFDTHALMQAEGGAAACLIDQWHFSSAFHAAVARALDVLLERRLTDDPLPGGHISHRYMLARLPDRAPLTLVGDEDQARAWREAHPEADVAAVARAADATVDTPLAVLLEPAGSREETAAALLRRLDRASILLYPEELEPLRNPAGADRQDFAGRDLRA